MQEEQGHAQEEAPGGTSGRCQALAAAGAGARGLRVGASEPPTCGAHAVWRFWELVSGDACPLGVRSAHTSNVQHCMMSGMQLTSACTIFFTGSGTKARVAWT